MSGVVYKASGEQNPNTKISQKGGELKTLSSKGDAHEHSTSSQIGGNTDKALRSVSDVPEALAVVVLHVHITTGDIRRCQGFCIDNQIGILVTGAHSLPLELEQLEVIEVHIYNTEEEIFKACFVAEPLAGGVSATFQNGGIDMALLRITHRYDSKAVDRRGVPVSDYSSIAQSLCALPIGTSGYEPRDQVSVIRYPIIEADSSRGCKPKCGRVVACVGSRLHLDFTELQDGDSGSLVINGAGEAIAFLMGRPPNREHTACQCAKVNSGSNRWSTPDNSVYYAQLLCGKEPQAFVRNVLRWNKLSDILSTNTPVPWGEYDIKSRIDKLEKMEGLTKQEKVEVTKIVQYFKQAMAAQDVDSLKQQNQNSDAMRKVSEAICKLDQTVKANEFHYQTKGETKIGCTRIEHETKEECTKNEYETEFECAKTEIDVDIKLLRIEDVEQKLRTRQALSFSKMDGSVPWLLAELERQRKINEDQASKLEARDEERKTWQSMLQHAEIKLGNQRKALQAHKEEIANLMDNREALQQQTMLENMWCVSAAQAHRFDQHRKDYQQKLGANIYNMLLKVTLNRLTSLKLKGTIRTNAKMTKISVVDLASALGRLTHLTELDLSNNALGASGISILAPELKYLCQLNKLCLQNNAMGPKGSKSLAPALDRLSHLTVLYLHNNDIGSTGCANLAPAIGQLTLLTVLIISGNDIGRQGARKLAPAIGHLKRLEKLGLADNNLGARGILALAPNIGDLTRLEELYLNNNRIGPRGAKALTAAFTKTNAKTYSICKLTVLKLQNNAIGTKGAAALVPVFARVKKMRKLFLQRNNFGAKGAEVLAPALGRLEDLSTLCLHNNGIGPKGAKALAPEISRLTKLTKLDLSANGIDANGAVLLAPALGRLQQLVGLTLSNNGIGVKGAKALAPELGRLKQLQLLHVQGNNVGAEGANALVEKMKSPKLTEISLHNNGIGAKGTADMKPALESLSQHGLTEISLNCDDIVTNDGKQCATDFEGINVKLFPESETSKSALRDVKGEISAKCDQPPTPERGIGEEVVTPVSMLK